MTSNSQPKVGILMPTRGLSFTEVEQYIEDVRSTYPNIVVFRTNSLPIPECFNTLAEQALQDKEIEYMWWIEEDTVPPSKTLDAFLDVMKEADIAAVDYGFNGGYNTIVKSEVTGKILFTGFGCTFMKRSVLEAFEKPVFKADKAFNISNLSWYSADPHKVYGMYDVLFGSEARKKGFTFTQVEGECRHLELLQLGEKGVNAGCHVIGEKDRISKKLTLPLKDF